MKRLLVIALVLWAAVGNVSAQSTLWKEWFKQKKTQKEYLTKQIAALQVYIGYAREGYTIYRNGLNTIGRIKDGDFNLHQEFFSSLKAVNPEVARYGRVADIIQVQLEIARISHKTITTAKRGGMLHADEVSYLVDVYARLLSDCSAVLDEVVTLISSGVLEMEDAERIARIEQLHGEMLSYHTFAQKFGGDANLLAFSRVKNQGETDFVGRLYGNNQKGK
ncbi:MAG: hypothetical protein P0Y53_01195 [Candidatus Pseudobacter hemicellulosilyticus]|uniref:TerB family tellurite resistance protein n=1 Tax=Candidatus Pseudobacter hemicellulosilyticus TaxID=3121375 RepID=A0AAJ5WV02_9BACT|nr:MAG: hypothetical protein P0Y53_01195 [Pseudobacter sp.]